MVKHKSEGVKEKFYPDERRTHEEAEIQHKDMSRGKNLPLSKETCLEKERVLSKVTPKQVGMALKRRLA